MNTLPARFTHPHAEVPTRAHPTRRREPMTDHAYIPPATVLAAFQARAAADRAALEAATTKETTHA